MPDAPNTPLSVNDIDNAPDDAAVALGDTPVSIDDYQKALAHVGSARDALQEKLELTEKRVRTTEILDKLIEPMARSSFVFMCSYCGVVGALITFHGFKLFGFVLPDRVLEFLVGSTAVTVIGLVGMVLTGVFVGARSNGKH